MKGTNLLCILTLFSSALFAQQIRINEVESSNANQLDEFGDSPDWIELYNPGADLNLNGWSLTDRKDDTLKWVFTQDLFLSQDHYLMVWASGRDLNQFGYTRTLVGSPQVFKMLVPNTTVPNWFTSGFDDSSWADVQAGVGYGDGDDVTVLNPGTPTVYLRKSFQVEDPSKITELIMSIDYDDGFVAYINGVEIARRNVSGTPPPYNAYATANHEALDYRGIPIQRITVNNPSSLLVEGSNVFAIEGHNVSGSSSDMSLNPFLTAKYNQSSNDGVKPPEIVKFTDIRPHTNFKLSAAGESVYLYSPEGILMDSVNFPALRTDVSYGEYDGTSSLEYFYPATPEAHNGGNILEGFLTKELTFSHPGGIMSTSVDLTISSTQPSDVIRYTTDGSMPDENSPVYSGAINISSNTIIRARVFRNGFLPSHIESRSFIFATDHSLPVISLITDPNNLFHPDSGMYVLGSQYPGGDFPYFGSNIWEDWERPVDISFYAKDGTEPYHAKAGAKIFGGWSRAQDQRSFSLFARSKYGDSSFEYPFFPDRPYSSFQSLVLRNSGNDFNNSQMRDVTLTSLMEGSSVDYQHHRQVAAYINGEYWGIYNIREKVNEHFLASLHGVDAESIDLLELDAQVVEGSNQEYLAFRNQLNAMNTSTDDAYTFIATHIDLEEYIQYQILQIYIDNRDWPGNNIKFWKHPDTQWRWVLYDTDFGFNIWSDTQYRNNTVQFALDPNGPGWPNPSWSTLLFRKLIQNTAIRHQFINQFADEMNTRFQPNVVSSHIETKANVIRGEINRHKSRWGGSYGDWSYKVNQMKNFANNRLSHQRNHILQEFNLPAYHPVYLSIQEPEGGRIQLNSLSITDASWTGYYFQNVPIEITAIPNEGYRFLNWSGDVSSEIPYQRVNITETSSLVANFIYTGESTLPLVINEINYNSSDDRNTEDWVEIYNPNPYFVDVSGFVLKDQNNDNSYTFPEGSTIGGEDFLIVARDPFLFSGYNPEVENVIGGFDFGFSADGDQVRIYTMEGILEDSVQYLSVEPWPIEANGQGPTLELIAPELDNALPESWDSGNPGGSPEKVNLIDDTLFGLINIFPNPFDDALNLQFGLKIESKIQVSMYDMTGRLIHSLTDDYYSEGWHELDIQLPDLERGLYYVTFNDGIEPKSFRVIKQ